MIVNNNKPWRYIGHPRKMTLWRSIVMLFRIGQWQRTELEFEPVECDDPRYEDAPYEAIIIRERDSLSLLNYNYSIRSPSKL